MFVLYHWDVTTGDKVVTISRQRSIQLSRCSLIEWAFMRQIGEFRSNFGNITRDCRMIVARLSYDSRLTFVGVLRIPTNVALGSFSFVRQ